MRFLLIGKCICGAPFQKDNQMKDVVLNETSEVSFICQMCKRSLKVILEWKAAPPEKKTTAQMLDGKRVDDFNKVEGSIQFNPTSGIHTFDDMSQAKIIIRFEDCKPFQTASLTTLSSARVRYWKAL